jgi:DNA-binding Lrp family transcriptional regulator
VESDVLDAIDRQIIHVIEVEPRASFRTIAEVTGVSDQTAARRYRRLREVAGLRVVGLVSGPAAGWTDWLIRLQTTPGGATGIADALVRRHDTKWVRMYAGGTEIVSVLQARTSEQRDALFLRGLPGSRRVVQISAHVVLHMFSPVVWDATKNALSAEQAARLTALTAGRDEDGQASQDGQDGQAGLAGLAGLAGPAGRLEPGDDPLLAELARDGRISTAALAAAIHWHESTVRRRVAELRAAGLLYFDVDIEDRALGFTVAAMFWLSIEPAWLDEAGRAIATHAEIPFAAAVTGAANLVANGEFRDTQHLYEYVSGRLVELPGLRSVETVPAIGTLKRAGQVGA